MSQADAAILAALQAMFTRSVQHSEGRARARIERCLAEGWRPTVLFEVVAGAPRLDLRIAHPNGLKFVSLRTVKA